MDDEGVAPRSRCADGGFKPPCAALAEDRRGERSRKRRPWAGVRWGSGRRMRVNRCGSVEMLGWHQNRGLKAPRDESGGGPCCWPVGARREGGVSPVCCVCVKQEKVPCSRAGGQGVGKVGG